MSRRKRVWGSLLQDPFSCVCGYIDMYCGHLCNHSLLGDEGGLTSTDGPVVAPCSQGVSNSLTGDALGALEHIAVITAELHTGADPASQGHVTIKRVPIIQTHTHTHTHTETCRKKCYYCFPMIINIKNRARL